MPLPPRHWFAFRLRTLFVVVAVAAVPLAWVAYSLNWIKQRHHVFHWLGEPGWSSTPVTAPGGLWLFGERGCNSVVWYESYGSDKGVSPAQMRALFPKATFRDIRDMRREQESQAAKIGVDAAQP
jgi:hypothetical protein